MVMAFGGLCDTALIVKFVIARCFRLKTLKLGKNTRCENITGWDKKECRIRVDSLFKTTEFSKFRNSKNGSFRFNLDWCVYP